MNYFQIYQRLIEKGQNRLLEGYAEKHHIIPRCMGGSNKKENLVSLTPEEHFVAHLLLVKMYPDNKKLIYAANMMNNRVKSNKEYGWLKRKFALIEKETKTGQKRSVDSCAKQSNTMKEQYKNGKKSCRLNTNITEEHKQQIRLGNLGKIIEESSKSNLAGFILRYGEIEGTELYKETCKKKDSASLKHYISKYGEDLGNTKFIEYQKNSSESRKGEKNPFYQKHHTNETKEILRLQKIGKKVFRSAEHNKKIGLANKGKKQPVITCEHCGKIGSLVNIKRWHNDNCKSKQD